MKTAVIGCGMISTIYLNNMIERFQNLEVVGCAAAHFENAKKKADKFGIKAMTVEEILADPSIELVVNLTAVPAHYEIIKKCLLAGKHVYTEKCLTLTIPESRELIMLAEEKGLMLGCAPETFLGEAIQTAKSIIESGRIGEITGFHVTINLDLDMMYPLFRILTLPGGDIGLDRGVYFLNNLIYLLGNVKQAVGSSDVFKPQRSFQAEDGSVNELTISNANRIAAVLQMESGVVGTMNLNGNTIMPELSRIEIYGTQGIMMVPDANAFGGEIRILKKVNGFEPVKEWEGIPCQDVNMRGIGPSKMADAIRSGEENPMDAKRALHIMEVFDQVSRS